jgi:hypothetical protein
VAETLEAQVRQWIATSELVQTIDEIRRDGGLGLALGGSPLRPLFKIEITQLESLGNTAEDWSRVRVASRFNPRRIQNCELRGDVILGEFKQRVRLTDGIEVIAGVSDSTIVDCVIGNDALVKDVRLLANYLIAPGAVVVNCGRITCGAGTSFGNGTRVAAALEGGGREIEVFAELDSALAAVAVRPGKRRPELEGYRRAVGDYRQRTTADRGVIGIGSYVWGVARLEDTFVGPAARIDGAALICRSTILSSVEAPVVVESGSMVTDSILQWGSRVTGMATVERSVLIEESLVERHGKVRDSIIGSNTHIAAGEVSSCLLGPFVGCPHQSLLISTYWPDGRGNVGYGANVGSNHTSRAPDQEFWAGEGLFIGLGVNVKFPCNFSQAPYTVIACGTNLAPQKVTFPFSLIAPPQEAFAGVPPSFNQISPGWMLRENIYALKRNEAKFRARNRARLAQFDFAVFRRSTVETMRAAISQLELRPAERPFYTDKDIAGLGKNVLTERDRLLAIGAYRFYTCYYALHGLKSRVAYVLATGKGDLSRLLATSSSHADWEFQRDLLRNEFGIEDAVTGLSLLGSMAQEIAKDCERAREKDDTRGVRIIDDYADVHPAADRDRIVRQAWEEADTLRTESEGLIRLFPTGMAERKLKITSFAFLSKADSAS